MTSGPPERVYQLDAAACRLDADAFVLRCFELAGADPADAPPGFVTAAVARLRAGAGRYQVLRDVAALADPAGARALDAVPISTGSLNADDGFFAEEMLTEFARGDDPAFVAESFNRLLGRRPTPAEARLVEDDLRAGRRDRHAVVADLAAERGEDAGPAPASLLAHRPDAAAARSTVERFIDIDGRRVWPILRFHRDLGWMVGRNVHIAAVTAAADGWRFRPGLLVRGPRLTLPVGRWRLQFSIGQPADAVLDLSVVANGGADVQMHVAVEGASTGALLFDVRAGQMFTEVIVAKPDQAEPLCRADIRLLQLSPVGP